MQEGREVELPQLPVLQAQAVEILILGEDACFAEKSPELTEEGAPLPGGHKTQGQRGDDRINTLVPATVYLLEEHLGTGIDDVQARVGDIGLQVAGKAGINLEGKQSRVGWNQVEQGLRHGPSAGAHFHNHPRLRERKRPHHGLNEVTRAGSNRANRTNVGHGLHGKRCQIRLRMATPSELTEISYQRQ